MFKNLFYLCFACAFMLFSEARAQSRLDWKPLDVTIVEEEETEESSPEITEQDGRFLNAFSNMKKALKERTQEKNREVKAVSREDVYSALEEMIEMSYPGGVDKMMEVHEQLEDDLYNLVMMMPKYTYQYFAPFFHTLPYMPERIMNIPEIKELKGKFPTRIAPQMQEYAKKHGKYMSPHLYIFLMPEAWPSQEREKKTFKGFNKIITIDEKTTPDDLFIMKDVSILKDHPMPSPEKYRTGAYLKKIVRPQTPANKVTHTSALTEGDVEAGLASLKSLKETFGNNRLDEFHKQIRRMSVSDDNLMEEMLNPMQTLVDKINRLPEAEKFKQAVGKHGFTPESWGMTIDKMIKARRVAKMSPGTAFTLKTWRNAKKMPQSFYALSPKDRQIAWESIQLFLGFYMTTEENLLAVENYGDNIRDAFATQDMTFMEAPVFGIY